jgi:hypothetical protein
VTSGQRHEAFGMLDVGLDRTGTEKSEFSGLVQNLS